MDDETRSNIKKIAETAAKLLNEVQRLHRDVVIVKGRIEPFNDEDISRIPPAHYIKPTWNLKDALNMIAECRSLVEGVERDVARIDGLIKGIENDAISREEMKPYLGKNRTD